MVFYVDLENNVAIRITTAVNSCELFFFPFSTSGSKQQGWGQDLLGTKQSSTEFSFKRFSLESIIKNNRIRSSLQQVKPLKLFHSFI